MVFNTYHWRDCPLDDPELERACAVLASETPDEDAFLALLRSGRTAAVGTALDHFHHADAVSRHGGGNPFAHHLAEVLERAREILSAPPAPSSETGAEKDGADHASALLAMLNHARPEDSGLIASALRQATTADTLEAATMAAATALERSTVLDEELISALRDIIFGESVAIWERVEALKAFNNVKSPRAADIAAQALESDDHDLQVHAAIILATHHLSTHRTVVEQVVESWPENVPYPAAAVLDALHADRPDHTRWSGNE
ncbi:hypothetical protein [Streptomyces coerulescens]|uniref:Uncharacterized protein n=1 Tax=Streptomyces coerulescens TaxID=29304 RepID=A0ABW0CSK0_STRCD